MKKLLPLLAIGLLAGPVFGQVLTIKPNSNPAPSLTPSPKVTLTAKGHEARDILGSLFQQAKKSYVLAPNLRSSLYLSLDDTPFEKALQIVCDQAKLSWTLKDDVYYVTALAAPAAPLVIAAKKAPVVTAKTKPVPVLVVPSATLAKRIDTRLTKNGLRTVAAEFSRQAGVPIEVDPSVPDYKIDAFLLGTSLKFALDEVTRATNLQYVYTAKQTILLRRKV